MRFLKSLLSNPRFMLWAIWRFCCLKPAPRHSVLRVIGRRGKIFIFVPTFLKIKFTKLPRKVEAKGPEWNLAVAINKKVWTEYGRFLIHILVKRIGCCKCQASLFITEMFSYGNA